MGAGELPPAAQQLKGRRMHAVPRIPANLVPRDRLMRRLEAMAALIAFRTLGGQGVTTLVAAWARRREDMGDRVVWVDQLDDDRALIWAKVRAAGHGNGGRTILVIDDAMLLRDRDFIEKLCELLRTESTVHVVACGGSLRDLLAAARRDRIECTILSGRDLMIDVQEVGDFARAWGHYTERGWLERLHALLGGHLLPLRVALAEGWSQHHERGLDPVREYLQTDVVARIEDVPLLRTARIIALGEVVTNETVAAVLEEVDVDSVGRSAHQVITDLWMLGVLSRVVGTADEWRFPELTRQTLVDAVTRCDPDVARRGHRVIGRRLLAEPHNLGRVLKHARLGHDWALLASLWARCTLTLLVEHPIESRFAFLGLPDEAFADQPMLVTPAALVTVESGDEAEMIAALRNRHRVEPSSERSDAEVLAAATTAMVVHLSNGDVAASLQLAETVARGIDVVRDGTGGVHAWFQLQWGITELLAADLSAASSRLARLHGAADRPDTAHIAASAAAHLAMIHALVGANVVAESCLQLAEATESPSGWLASMVSTPVTIARAQLSLDRLDQSAATEAIGHLQWRVHEQMWPCIVYVSTQGALHFSSAVEVRSWLEPIELLHARHLVADGLARQLLVLARCDVLLALGEVNRAHALIATDEPRHWRWTRLARVRLMTGDHLGALELASSSAAHPNSTVREQVDQLMISAAALHSLGRDAEHREVAAKAHLLAEHAGIDSACLKVPAGACGRQHDHPSGSQRPFPVRAQFIALSPREAHVLALMREHDTLAAIARSLTVSINTVKKQSIAIHSKLGVRDRPAALMRAEALGLLAPKDANQH